MFLGWVLNGYWSENLVWGTFCTTLCCFYPHYISILDHVLCKQKSPRSINLGTVGSLALLKILAALLTLLLFSCFAPAWSAIGCWTPGESQMSMVCPCAGAWTPWEGAWAHLRCLSHLWGQNLYRMKDQYTSKHHRAAKISRCVYTCIFEICTLPFITYIQVHVYIYIWCMDTYVWNHDMDIHIWCISMSDSLNFPLLFGRFHRVHNRNQGQNAAHMSRPAGSQCFQTCLDFTVLPQWFVINVGIRIINHPFEINLGMACTNYLWWFRRWFIVVIPKLMGIQPI